MQSRALLMRPRLRSKRGCLTCRKRRKKCDEQRPRCADCSRQSLCCTWPSETKSPTIVTTTNIADTDSNSPLSTTSLLSTELEPPRPRGLNMLDRSLFHHFKTNLLPLVHRAEAHPGYSDTNDLFLTGLHYPLIMKTILAVAALHRSQKSISFRSVAYSYYYTAIREVRERIGSGTVEGTEDWLLASTIFFYLFEVWSLTPPNNAMHHIEGVAQLFSLRRAKGFQGDSSPSAQAFYRVAAESFLFHIATMSLFHEDVNRLSSKFSWEDLEDGLSAMPFPEASKSANSPIIGPTPHLYRLVFDITRLSSYAPLEGSHYLEALRYQNELRLWSVKIEKATSMPGFEFSDQLYIITLQIFLVKLLYPEIHSTNQHILLLVRKAIQLIEGSDDTDPSNLLHLCWPIFILACAIDFPADKALMQQKLIEVWRESYFGQVRRWAIAIDTVWKMRDEMSSKEEFVDTTPSTFTDGLDLLINRRLFLQNL